jgi:hypothetical protein
MCACYGARWGMLGVGAWVFGRAAQAMGFVDGGRFVGFKERGSQAVLRVDEQALNTEDIEFTSIMGYGEWVQSSFGVDWWG